MDQIASESYFRTLEPWEIEAVSGGDGWGEEITVYGGGGGGGDTGGGGGSYGGDGGLGSGGGGDGGSSATPGLSDLEWLLDHAIQSAKDWHQREADVGAKFNPNNVIATQTAPTGVLGTSTATMWAMTDGRAFVDSDGDGAPDTILSYDNVGDLWASDGSVNYEIHVAGQ